MIRSAIALPLVLTLGSISFAQTTGGNASRPEADRSSAYYHFAMGRLYAELAGSEANPTEDINKAIQNYQEALKADPSADVIFEELTDLYIQTGRVQDAIAQAQDLLQKNPNNLDARRMLGRIYMRAISNAQGNRINEAMVRNAIDQYKQITEKDPKDVESWVILGRLYAVSNDAANAEKSYNEALKARPNDEDALTGLAMLYSDQGDMDRAIAKLKAATDKAPNARTLTALADAYERTHDYKNAADAMRRALALAPDNSRVQEGLARDLLFSDQFDEALSLYQQLAGDDPSDAQLQLRIAQIYRAKHDLVKARQTLDKAKKLDPNDLDLAAEDVNLLEAEGKTDQAITQLKSLLDSTAHRNYSPAQGEVRAQLLERLALLYRSTSQYGPAIDALKQAQPLAGDGAPRVTVLLVDTYRQAKDLDSAQREADAALKKFPDERMVRIAHAELLADMGKVDEGADEVKALAKGAPDRDTQLELAQIYQKGKRWTEMGKSLDAAEKLCTSDDQRVAVYFMRGAMYERLKKYDEAETEFRKVIQLDSKNAGAMNYLGYMLADRGVRLDEAQSLIQKALELDPGNGAYLDSMGWVYYREGKLEQAEQLLVQALDRIGEDPTVHDHLGDIYFKLGKTKEAIAQWQLSVKAFQSAVASDADPEALAKVNKKLEGARVRLAKETKQK